MRPAYVRELQELSPAVALLVASAVNVGIAFTGPLSREFDDLLIFPVVAGLALGCVQGALDRWRRGDLFHMHRPVPAARIEAARSLAGFTVALAGLVALVVSHRLATESHLANLQALNRGWVATFEPPYHLGPREISLVASVLLAAWAIARFSAGAVRPAWALPALIAVPLASWSLLARATTTPAATGIALAMAFLFSLGSGLCLAGGRR